MRRLALFGAVLALGNLAQPSHCAGQVMRTLAVARPSGAERFLHVTLEFNGGSVLLTPAPAGRLYGMRVRYDPDRYAPVQQYDPRTGILRLGVESVGGMGVRVTSRAQLEQIGRFEFATDVPLAVYATLGASDATIDLGGTTLTDLELRVGATHATVDFSRPTRGNCKSATFSVGASQLDVQHLAWAGCAALRIDGGAGRATLGFQGEWRRDATLVVDLMLGSLTLQIPRGTGVRLIGQRFLAPFDGRGFVKSGDVWQTPGFEQAVHKLNVELKASLVNIDVQWTGK